MLSACDDPEEKSKNSGPDNDFGSISKTFRLVAGESRIPLSSLFSLRPNISTIVTLVGYRVIEKSCLSFSFAVLRSEAEPLLLPREVASTQYRHPLLPQVNAGTCVAWQDV